MRELEQKKAGSSKPSKPELEVFDFMVNRVKEKIQRGIPRDASIEEVLQDVTSRAVMDRKLASGELGGKIKITPIGE